MRAIADNLWVSVAGVTAALLASAYLAAINVKSLLQSHVRAQSRRCHLVQLVITVAALLQVTIEALFLVLVVAPASRLANRGGKEDHAIIRDATQTQSKQTCWALFFVADFATAVFRAAALLVLIERATVLIPKRPPRRGRESAAASWTGSRCARADGQSSSRGLCWPQWVHRSAVRSALRIMSAVAILVALTETVTRRVGVASMVDGGQCFVQPPSATVSAIYTISGGLLSFVYAMLHLCFVVPLRVRLAAIRSYSPYRRQQSRDYSAQAESGSINNRKEDTPPPTAPAHSSGHQDDSAAIKPSLSPEAHRLSMLLHAVRWRIATASAVFVITAILGAFGAFGESRCLGISLQNNAALMASTLAHIDGGSGCSSSSGGDRHHGNDNNSSESAGADSPKPASAAVGDPGLVSHPTPAPALLNGHRLHEKDGQNLCDQREGR